MGIYLNPGNDLYLETYNDTIFVDKSMLINELNQCIKKASKKYVCVSRPRRFGKSTDVNMLVAYYSKGCDSKELFDSLKISKSDSYLKHLNQYQVIYLNMQDFLSQSHDIENMLKLISKSLIWELLIQYQDLMYFDKDNIIRVLHDIYNQRNVSFIFIIDEWDCIFRNKKQLKI